MGRKSKLVKEPSSSQSLRSRSHERSKVHGTIAKAKLKRKCQVEPEEENEDVDINEEKVQLKTKRLKTSVLESTNISPVTSKIEKNKERGRKSKLTSSSSKIASERRQSLRTANIATIKKAKLEEETGATNSPKSKLKSYENHDQGQDQLSPSPAGAIEKTIEVKVKPRIPKAKCVEIGQNVTVAPNTSPSSESERPKRKRQRDKESGSDLHEGKSHIKTERSKMSASKSESSTTNISPVTMRVKRALFTPILRVSRERRLSLRALEAAKTLKLKKVKSKKTEDTPVSQKLESDSESKLKTNQSQAQPTTSGVVDFEKTGKAKVEAKTKSKSEEILQNIHVTTTTLVKSAPSSSSERPKRKREKDSDLHKENSSLETKELKLREPKSKNSPIKITPAVESTSEISPLKNKIQRARRYRAKSMMSTAISRGRPLIAWSAKSTAKKQLTKKVEIKSTEDLVPPKPESKLTSISKDQQDQGQPSSSPIIVQKVDEKIVTIPITNAKTSSAEVGQNSTVAVTLAVTITTPIPIPSSSAAMNDPLLQLNKTLNLIPTTQSNRTSANISSDTSTSDSGGLSWYTNISPEERTRQWNCFLNFLGSKSKRNVI